MRFYDAVQVDVVRRIISDFIITINTALFI